MATGRPIANRMIPGTTTLVPTVERSYGIKYKRYPFISQDWSEAWIWYANTTYHYVENCPTIMSWFDYSGACQQLAGARNWRYWSDFQSEYAVLLNGCTEDVYESQVWKDKYNQFINDIAFLEGSMEEGGVFIVKAADNPTSTSSLSYWIVMYYGLYTKVINEVNNYKIAIWNAGSNRHSLRQLQRVAWAVHDDTKYYQDGQPIEPKDSYNLYSLFLAGEPNRWLAGNYQMSMASTNNVEATKANAYIPTEVTGPAFVQMPIRAWLWDSGSDNTEVQIYDYSPTDWDQIQGLSDEGYIANPSNSGNTMGGGNGNPDTSGDDIDDESLTDLNSLTALNSGLVTLYRPTREQLSSFANFLYSGLTDSAVTQLKKLVTNPLDYIIFVALCKFTPPVAESMEEIAFCGIGTGVLAGKITQQFIDVPCGNIIFNEQFASFLDYAPHSKLKIYLPYCGTHDLNIDECMGSIINVKYRIDMLSGSCLAKIKISRQARSTAPQDSSINSIVYEYTGNCYLTMPLSATDWRGTYQALVGLAGGVIGGIALGGAGGAIGIAQSVASSVTSQKVSVSRSGQEGSAYGYMGEDKPYLILERPIQSVPNQFGLWEGYSSNILEKVANLSGYTEIDTDTIWSDNFGHATQEECQMIKDIMNGGVYL